MLSTFAPVMPRLSPRGDVRGRGGCLGGFMRFRKRSLAGLFLLLLDLLPSGANAQTAEPLLPVPPVPTGPQAPAAPGQPIFPGETVLGRARPEFNPTGLRVGSFFWFPRAEVDEAYNTNIFATPTSTTSDLITLEQPSFDLLSNFSGKALNLHGGAAFQEYASHPSQNTEDGFVAVDGRLDVSAGSSFHGGATLAHSHLSRTSPDQPGNAAQPVTYNSIEANAGYTQSGLRFGYDGDVAVLAQQYNAVPLIGGGLLPQSGNDVDIYQANLRLNYEFVPDYLGYLRLSENFRNYPKKLPVPGALSFNSLGYRIDLGLQILPFGISYGEIYAGYLSQNFFAHAIGNLSGIDAGGRYIWNVTRLTTLTFGAQRAVETSNPSIGNTGAGYLASAVTLTADHELLRNLLLSANVAYENDAYAGVSRTDNVFSVGATVRYLLTRNLYLGGSYTYNQRASSGTARGLPYAQSIVMVRISTQF